MQFRQVQSKHSQTILAIRSVYNRGRKRCDQVIVGRFNLWDAEITSDKHVEMTADEITQANAWLLARYEERALASLPSSSPMIIREIDLVIGALREGRSDVVLSRCSGSELYEATDRLRKALRRIGVIPRPAKVEEPIRLDHPTPLFESIEELHPSEARNDR